MFTLVSKVKIETQIFKELIYKQLIKNGREGVPSGTDSISIVRPQILGLISKNIASQALSSKRRYIYHLSKENLPFDAFSHPFANFHHIRHIEKTKKTGAGIVSAKPRTLQAFCERDANIYYIQIIFIIYRIKIFIQIT